MINYNRKLLFEDEDRLDLTKDDSIMTNRFTTYPQGFFIYDTFNNPFFPIEWIRLDSDRYDTSELFKRYKEKFTKVTGAEMMPWHFTLEMVKLQYYAINTRPLNLKFPLTNERFKNSKWRMDMADDRLKQFLLESPFDMSEAIHIAIVGDTNFDVYPKKMYKVLVRNCIDPFVRYFKIPKAYIVRIIPVNLGNKIVFESILNMIRV